MKTKNISRRNFIRIGGITGAALTIGYYLPSSGKGGQFFTGDIADELGIPLNAFISIDTNGRVTIRCQKSEMGQGAWTVIPQMVAEELEVDINKVNILFAPSDPKKYGSKALAEVLQ
jgi:isoquinoline 1-oxidoreductase beta subunit